MIDTTHSASFRHSRSKERRRFARLWPFEEPRRRRCGQRADSIVKQPPASVSHLRAIARQARATPGTHAFFVARMERSEIRDSSRRVSPGFRHSRCVASAFFKNGGLKAAYAIRATGVQTRVIAPRLVRPQGAPVFSVPFSRKGRAERQGVSPRPRRHVRAHGIRVLWAHGNNKQPRTQIVARVPHANGFFGLLHH